MVLQHRVVVVQRGPRVARLDNERVGAPAVVDVVDGCGDDCREDLEVRERALESRVVEKDVRRVHDVSTVHVVVVPNVRESRIPARNSMCNFA